MRFEVSAAYAMGIALPLFETLRRKTNFDNFHRYVDDFIIGALPVYGAHAVTRGKRNGPVLLAVAWAVLCGGLYGSFFWQLFSTEALDISGLPNTTVIIVKGVLYAIALTALVFASRSAIHLVLKIRHDVVGKCVARPHGLNVSADADRGQCRGQPCAPATLFDNHPDQLTWPFNADRLHNLDNLVGIEFGNLHERDAGIQTVSHPITLRLPRHGNDSERPPDFEPKTREFRDVIWIEVSIVNDHRLRPLISKSIRDGCRVRVTQE